MGALQEKFGGSQGHLLEMKRTDSFSSVFSGPKFFFISGECR
jgi:hypothetical protein